MKDMKHVQTSRGNVLAGKSLKRNRAAQHGKIVRENKTVLDWGDMVLGNEMKQMDYVTMTKPSTQICLEYTNGIYMHRILTIILLFFLSISTRLAVID